MRTKAQSVEANLKGDFRAFSTSFKAHPITHKRTKCALINAFPSNLKSDPIESEPHAIDSIELHIVYIFAIRSTIAGCSAHINAISYCNIKYASCT